MMVIHILHCEREQHRKHLFLEYDRRWNPDVQVRWCKKTKSRRLTGVHRPGTKFTQQTEKRKVSHVPWSPRLSLP